MRCSIPAPQSPSRLRSALALLLYSLVLAGTLHAQAPATFGVARGIAFEQNRGQVADAEGRVRPDILYTAESRGVRLFLSRSALSYVFQRYEGDWEAWHRADGHITDEFLESFRREQGREFAAPRIAQFRVDLELVGSNPNVQVVQEEERSDLGYRNFYLGHCPDGVLDVRSYSQVTYRELYHKIDMVLRSTDSGMKCDFVVHPGGNPADIKMRYVGAERVSLDEEGGITAITPLGYTSEEAPITYMTDGASGVLQRYSDGVRTAVESRFHMANGIISFDLGAYDSRRTLVIDPYRLWSTYYGGPGTENLVGGDVSEVDRNGHVLFAGSTGQTGYPITPGAFQTAFVNAGDVVVTKIRNSGTGTLWSTYYGGSSSELAHGIVTDPNRNVFVAGHTFSSNFPVLNAFQGTMSTKHPLSAPGSNRDAFVIKFDSNGVRQWATFYGAAGNDFDDGYGFAIDSSGNPALVSTTDGLGLATLGQTTYGGGGYDAMIVKFDGNTGARLWSTYLGGLGDDYGFAASSDINNNIIVAGYTGSSNFPTLNATQPTLGGGIDAFVGKYTSLGAKLWATYWGGSNDEQKDDGSNVADCALATDDSGRIFLTGYTLSSDFWTSSGAFQSSKPGTGTGNNARDAFVSRFYADGRRAHSTFFGVPGVASDDIGKGVASNNSGQVLVTGYTSAAMPTASGFGDFVQTANAGGRDAFIAKLDSTLSTLRYATMYGGSGSDAGVGISFDPFGSIVVVGTTASSNFPLVGNPNVLQSSYAGNTDVWVLLLCDIERDLVSHTNGTRIENTVYLCWNDSTELYVKEGYRRYQWLTTGDTTSRIKNRPSIPGYTVTLTNGAGCSAQSDTVFVTYLPRPNPNFSGPSRICAGDTVTVTLNYSTATGLGTVNYTILDSATRTPQPGMFLNGPVGAKTHRFWSSGTYFAIIETSNGCRDTSRMFRIDVVPRPLPVSVAPGDTICDGETATLTASRAPIAGEIFTWSNGRTGQTNTVTTTGVYYLRVSNGVCEVRSDSARVLVRPNPVPLITASPAFQFCKGDTITLTAQRGFRRYAWNTGRPGDTTNVIRVWETGTITLRVTDSNGCQGETSVAVERIEPPQVILSTIGTPPYCDGDTVILTAGTGFGFYEWSNGVFGVPELRVTTSGRYKVKVQLAGVPYCEGESNEVEITFRPRPRVDIAGPLAACVGSLTSYTAPKGSGITYQWQVSGAGGAIISGQGTDSATVRWGATPGTGSVHLTIRIDSSFCTRDTTIEVAVGSALKPSVVPGNNITLCPGDSVRFSIGNGYVFQEWTNRAGSVLGNTPDLVVRDSGIYFVDVRDANGCAGRSDTIRVRISSPAAPVITALGRTAICPDSSVVLEATSGYRSYTWQPGGQTNRSIVARDSGTYRVVAVDSNGCTVTSDPIAVTFATPPTPEIVGPGSICVNSSSTYSVRGGSPANSYEWTIGSSVGTIVSGQGSNTITVNWGGSSGATTLSVVEHDLATGCSGISDPFFATVNTSLLPVITTSNNQSALCDGDSLVLRAAIGYVSYTWSDASGATLGMADTLVVRGAGTYTVMVSDGTCSGSGDFTVTQKAQIIPEINANGPLQFCDGDSVQLRADPGYVRYRWSTGDTTESIVVKASGAYSVTVQDADGCSGTSGSLDVMVTPRPTAILTQSGDTLIASPSSGGYSFRWFRDGTLIVGAGPTYVTTLNGRYTVEISSGGLCSDTASLDVGGVALASIGVKEFEAAPGETVTIPVMLWSEQNLDRNGIHTFTLRFRYDRSLLVPLDASWPSTFVDTDRVLTLSGTLPAGFNPGGDPLVTLRFVAAIGRKTETPLVIEEVTFGEGPVGTTIENGFFRLRDLCTTGGTRLVDASGSPGLKVIRPNPAQGATELEYETVEDGVVRIVLVNTLGQTIPVMEATVERGRYAVPFDVHNLPSGPYTVVLTTPTQRWTAPMRVQE